MRVRFLVLAALMPLACRTALPRPEISPHETLDTKSTDPTPTVATNPTPTTVTDPGTSSPSAQSPSTDAGTTTPSPTDGSTSSGTTVASSSSGTAVNNGAGPTGTYLKCQGVDDAATSFFIRGTAAVTFNQGGLHYQDKDVYFTCHLDETQAATIPGQPRPLWNCDELTDPGKAAYHMKSSEYSTGLISAVVTQTNADGTDLGVAINLDCTVPKSHSN